MNEKRDQVGSRGGERMVRSVESIVAADEKEQTMEFKETRVDFLKFSGDIESVFKSQDAEETSIGGYKGK